MDFAKFPSIEAFKNVLYHARKMGCTDITYGFKVKLHGTNAGIRYDGETFTAQSRTRSISPGDDNYGFASWLEEVKEVLRPRFTAMYRHFGPFTAYGEWCGKGIQSKVAVSQVDRFFAPFAVYQHNGDMFYTGTREIQELFANVDSAIPLLWHSALDCFIDDTSCIEEFKQQVEKYVSAIDAECPFAKHHLFTSGVGEGLVAYPMCVNGEAMLHTKGTPGHLFRALTFKAKGSSHSGAKEKVVVEVDIARYSEAATLASKFATEQRIAQALHETGASFDRVDSVGQVIKWMVADIHKEAALELEAAGFTSKSELKKVDAAVVSIIKQHYGV